MNKTQEQKIRSIIREEVEKINEGFFDHRSEFPSSVPMTDKLNAIKTFKETQIIFNNITHYFNKELLHRFSKLINSSKYFEISKPLLGDGYLSAKIILKPEYKNLIRKRTIELFINTVNSCNFYVEDRESNKPAYKFYKKGAFEIVILDFATHNKSPKRKILYVESSLDLKKLGSDYVKRNEQIIKDWIEVIDNLDQEDFIKPVYKSL